MTKILLSNSILLKKCFSLKGTVMQTEKTLINDRLRVSKVSWNIVTCLRYHGL